MNEGIVNYIEKGNGLHEAIEKTGHYLKEEDGVWIGGGPNGPAYVQAIIDTYENKDIEADKMEIPITQFYLLLKSEERIAFRSSAHPAIKDWMMILDDPRLTVVDLLDSATRSGLQLAEDLGIIQQGRIERIISGQRPE